MLIKFILHQQQHQQDKSESDRLESLSINNAVKELTSYLLSHHNMRAKGCNIALKSTPELNPATQ